VFTLLGAKQDGCDKNIIKICFLGWLIGWLVPQSQIVPMQTKNGSWERCWPHLFKRRTETPAPCQGGRCFVIIADIFWRKIWAVL